MEENPRPHKRPKTTHEQEHRGYQYRRMLVRVAQQLGKEEVQRLAVLANLPPLEKDEILQRQEGWPDALFEKLEQKEIIHSGDVSWLKQNLELLENAVAVKIVEEYIPESLEEIPDEPESDESNESECQANTTFEKFLVAVHLQEEFPQKLTLKSFLTVRDEVNPQKLVLSFWQRLTSLDYRSGYPQHYVLEDFSMRDFIFAVLHCADDFLRQDILEKMSACQLAVPMVLNGVEGKKPQFLLWALRRIMKKWKGRLDSCALEQPIVNYPVFMVSVLRVGDVRMSKSQLLNTMLGYTDGTSHSFFLSKEKDSVKPVFSVGSLECAWFLPLRGNDKDIFPVITAFFNLRGDCRKYPAQTRFACKAADLTLAFIATDKRERSREYITDIRKHSRKTLFVSIRDESKSSLGPQKTHKPEFSKGWLFVKVLQVDVLSREISKHIATSETEPGNYRSLESLCDICGSDIEIDENDPSCQQAKKNVKKIFESFESGIIPEWKREAFPLQDILKEWVGIDKDKFQDSNDPSESFDHQLVKMHAEKREKREQQLQIGFSKTIESYYNTIYANQSDPKSLHYIFAFMQEEIYQMVNDNTQRDINQLSKLGDEIKSQEERKKKVNAEEPDSSVSSQSREDDAVDSSYPRLVAAYNDLLKSCQSKNLGCEHFLRELGQLFEAFDEIKTPPNSKISTADVVLLPSLAARLVVELHSFELMDGDTGSVPLVWITNVLYTLTRNLSDPRILVISVIGVQSSGKSTLLNTMFGLRFPVRAGRCTRGLFFRLLQLDESLADELGFSYLVVVDTEGIQSIDHDDRRYDNELVTLALGIANITIFNIEGENIGPDMTGILQIAAHALMRMKQVDLECHCRIVQQRVSDVTAAERNKANTNRIMETLDEATKLAAEEEGLQGRYSIFSDVVDLQVDESLQYIPCLWTGGMSPPNHMYSETVSKLKARLIQDIRDKKIVPELRLSHFTGRVEDVWRAVKEENFVFNFQDSVRAVAFNKLCLEYNKWIVEMRQTMMSVTASAYRMLEIHSVSPFSISEPMITPGADIDDIKGNIRTTAEDERIKVLTCLESYIAKHPQKQTIHAYKQGFVDDVNLVVKEVENQALTTINDEYELQQVKLNLPKFQKKWRHSLTLKAKREAHALRRSGVERVTRSIFETIWKKWMENITNDMIQMKSRSPITCLQTVCEKLLLRVTSNLAIGSEVRSLMEKEGGIDKHPELGDCSRYIHDKFMKAWLMQKDSKGGEVVPKQRIEQEIVNVKLFVQGVISENVSKMLQSNAGRAFDENGYQLMLRETIGSLTTNERTFKPPSTLIAKGMLHLSCIALRELERRQTQHEYPCAFWLQEEKELLSEDFRAFFSADETIIAERCAHFLFYFLSSLYRQKLLNKYFSRLENRKPFRYESIDNTPWKFLRHFARTNALSLIGDLSDVWRDFQRSLHKMKRQTYDEEISKLREEVEETLGDFKCNLAEQNPDLQSWLNNSEFSLEFPRNIHEIFGSLSYSSVNGMLERLIRSYLRNEIVKDLAINFQLSYIGDLGGTLTCQHTCPMCGVPCNSTARHTDKHFSFLHRPRGFSGELYGGNNKLVTDDCTTVISENPFTWKGEIFSDYKSAFPDWRIPPPFDNPGIKFWHWIMAQHNEFLAQIHDCDEADIPWDWYDITENEALDSLHLDELTKLEGRFAVYNDRIHAREYESQ